MDLQSIQGKRSVTVRTRLIKSSLLLLVCVMLPLLVLSGCGAGSHATSASTPTAQPASINISLTPSSVLPGQSATLTWSSSNATSCTGSGAWSGTLQGSGAMNVILQGTVSQAYTLKCTGDGGAAFKTATLALAPAAGACATSQAVRAHHGMQSRALAAARKAVATGTAGPRRSGAK